MRFLIVHQDPDDFAAEFYASERGLGLRPFDVQFAAREKAFHGAGASCSTSLIKLGHEAMDVYANLSPMQQAWARENRVSYDLRDQIMRMKMRFGVIPWLHFEPNGQWVGEILAAQIKAYRPDVIYSYSLKFLNSQVLRAAKGSYRMAIGHQISGLPFGDISAYNLLLTVQDQQAEYWSSQDLRSETLHLAYDHFSLRYLNNGPQKYEISFFGDLTTPDNSMMRILDSLCRKHKVSIWGRGAEYFPKGSPVRKAHRGLVWGLLRYQAMRDSKIVLLSRSESLKGEAFESLLFDSTGVGALTLCDADAQPDDLFRPGKEILTYRTPEQCMVLADYYLNRDKERQKIALAGQARTHAQHTYLSRMQDLIGLTARLQMEFEPAASAVSLATGFGLKLP